jgi:hypothetical protein
MATKQIKTDNRPIKIIKDNLEDEWIENIFDVLNSIDCETILYFSSQGGVDAYAEVVIEILNNNTNLIELVGYGPLASNGFEVFSRFKGKKRLLPTAIGMIHLGDFPISARKRKDTTYQDFILSKFVDDKNKEQINKYSPFLSKEEINSLEKGGEVWVSYERMKKIFNV